MSNNDFRDSLSENDSDDDVYTSKKTTRKTLSTIDSDLSSDESSSDHGLGTTITDTSSVSSITLPSGSRTTNNSRRINDLLNDIQSIQCQNTMSNDEQLDIVNSLRKHMCLHQHLKITSFRIDQLESFMNNVYNELSKRVYACLIADSIAFSPNKSEMLYSVHVLVSMKREDKVKLSAQMIGRLLVRLLPDNEKTIHHNTVKCYKDSILTITRDCQKTLFNEKRFDTDKFHNLWKSRTYAENFELRRKLAAEQGKSIKVPKPAYDAFFSRQSPNIAQHLYQAFETRQCELYKDVKLQVVDLDQFSKNSWEYEAAEKHNRWALHDFDLQDSIVAKEYPHIWIEGPPNANKTRFVRDVLLKNIPEKCIFIPNMSNSSFKFEGYIEGLHKCVLIDEAPRLHKHSWDINLLKKILSGSYFAQNIRHQKVETQVNMQIPFYFTKNGLSSLNRIKNDPELAGLLERIAFIQIKEIPFDTMKEQKEFLERREQERIQHRLNKQMANNSTASINSNINSPNDSLSVNSHNNSLSIISSTTIQQSTEEEIERRVKERLEQERRVWATDKRKLEETLGELQEQMKFFKRSLDRMVGEQSNLNSPTSKTPYMLPMSVDNQEKEITLDSMIEELTKKN